MIDRDLTRTVSESGFGEGDILLLEHKIKGKDFVFVEMDLKMRNVKKPGHDFDPTDLSFA